MKSAISIKQRFALIPAFLLAICGFVRIANAQVFSGSSGIDGALDFSSINHTTNIVIDMHDHTNGVYQYSYINIPASVTITFITNANNSPVTWLVQSNVTINGSVNLAGGGTTGNPFGSGYPVGQFGGVSGPGGWPGGNGGANGPGPGGGTPPGGGGFGTPGNPVYGGTGGSTYGNPELIPLIGGSGGSGGGQYGSGGGGAGGAIYIAAVGTITINGTIDAHGNLGFYSGGGSGGAIKLMTANLSGNGQINCGGNTDGGGLGRVRIGALQNTFTGTISGVSTLGFDDGTNMLITIQPTSQADAPGTTAIMSVGIYGVSPIYFQWYFNSNAIVGATSQTLSLPNVSSLDQGYYSVVVSNSVKTITSSNAFLTVLDGRDFDGDGIPNYWEQQYSLNINNPNDATNHPSGDQLTYLQKYLYGLDPTTIDTDGDGLSDYDEIFIYHTNPLLTDTDGDGIPDNWEIQHGLNPLLNDAGQIGTAGVSSLQIYQYDLTHTNQLDPHNPFFAPGTSIYESLNNGQHTNRIYYDRDDRLIGEEFSRGLSIAYKYDGNGNPIRQTYLSRASETNGLPVLWQFLNGLTNNASIYTDSDGDGWSTYQEWQAGTDPNNSQSTPNQISNPGTNIASLVLPFTPSNFVVGVGQLDGLGANEIVVGADGNPGTNMNSLLVLTQTFTGWSTQRVDIGFFGVTSIAVGQLTNRPAPAIYIGLRGTTNGSGRVMEFASSGGIWQSNLVVLSTNKTAFVLGVRGQDLLVSCGTTNTLDGELSAASFSTNWNLSLLDTNVSNLGLGTLFQTQPQLSSSAALRLLDSGGISVGQTGIGPTQNLVGYWNFNDGTAVDGSGNGNNGTIQGAVPTNGIIGGALSFDGAGGRVQMNSSASLNLRGALTISAWINPSSNPLDPTGTIVRNGINSDELYLLEYIPSGGISFEWFDTDWRKVLSPTNVVSPEHWNQVAVTKSDSQFIRLYVNGQEVTNFQGTVPTSATPTLLTIGSTQPGSVGLDFRGIIDDVRIYDRTLNSTELAAFSIPASFIPEPQATKRYLWRGKSLASGIVRSEQTNATSVFYAFGDDLNGNNNLDAGDDFVTAEYSVAATNMPITTLSRQRIASSVIAQSYGLASVNYLNQSNVVLFTGEPDGQVFVWTDTGPTNPLQRQLFSAQHTGKAWHALTGVKTLEAGEGLAGLRVDPTNQNRCDVIFWSPQTHLPQIVSASQTAPAVAVIPSANPLGNVAVVNIRLWDNEGNAATPFLQYQILGSTSWQYATLTALDGATYNPATRVAALPTGNYHTLAWNAANDLGAGVVTNILLRACAQDFGLVGEWSAPTPFAVSMNQDSNTNGIPDWWETQHFGSLQPANGDFDQDGFSNYAEYIADTDPADPNSNLRITKIQPVTGSIAIIWQGGIQSTQYLQQRFSLNPTSSWVEIFTNLPPTANPSGFTNYGLTNNSGFYRIRVTR